jgi:plasmid stabilization system protein ParE
MTHHVIIQSQAEAEIEAVYLWKRDNAPQAAARWFAGIVEAINSLDQFPARCPLAPENEHFTRKSSNTSTALATTWPDTVAG